MPTITVEGPIIADLEKKRILVKKITEAAFEAYEVEKSHITVTIKGFSPDNVGVGGMLLSDLRKMREKKEN